jgi:large-conductance mechanosensitive channel
MDETPKGLLREFRASVLKKRVGQIALAVLMAQAALQLITTVTWYLIIPVLAKFLRGQTESVLFEKSADSPIRWDTLFGSVLIFLLVLILVLYLNRWIQRRSKPADLLDEEPVISENEALTDTTGSMK